MTTTPASEIEEGFAALAGGSWSAARERFSEALAKDETPDAYEGLGVAARYELDGDAAIEAHERGFQLARSQGDDAVAARLAIQLSFDAQSFRGPAEAAGWLERAAILVEGKPPTEASAFVPALRAYRALLVDHDPETALELSEDAIALAKEVGVIDIEIVALALHGLAQVSTGSVKEGMRRLDAAAAAAVGGEMSDADSIETVCCFVIDACKKVRDLDRADEWCLRVREIATRFGDRQMFSVCRTHYADVLMWRGDWDDAEAELIAAASELEAMSPGRGDDGFVRLAELRRRQGRVAEAEDLLERAESHRFHTLVTGRMALERGDARSAHESANRFLRRIGESDRFERVEGLELLVRAALASDDRESAQAGADEIAAIADATPTPPLRAAAFHANGVIARKAGEPGRAIALLEDACDQLDRSGARYDAAMARLDLASALQVAENEAEARKVKARARDELAALGSVVPAESEGLLSPREAEVLRLLARGLSNSDIASELVLSVRTVERHTANIYAKIDASGRTARAIATAWAHKHGVT